MPHFAARGWVQETMPLVLCTTLLLLLNFANWGLPSGKRSFVGRGILRGFLLGAFLQDGPGEVYKVELWMGNGRYSTDYLFSTESLMDGINNATGSEVVLRLRQFATTLNKEINCRNGGQEPLSTGGGETGKI